MLSVSLLMYMLASLYMYNFMFTENYWEAVYLSAVGHCSSSEVSVVVLPFSQICRFGCRVDLRNDYYIWHKGGNRDKKSKMKGAKQGRTWFLKERWNELYSDMIVDVKWISMHINVM